MGMLTLYADIDGYNFLNIEADLLNLTRSPY